MTRRHSRRADGSRRTGVFVSSVGSFSLSGGDTALRPLLLAVQMAAVGAALAVPVWAPQAQAQVQAPVAESRRYDIPAGPLTAALNAFAEQAGILLSAPGDLTRDKVSSGLSGNFTVEQGFSRLLTGSGLTAAAIGDSRYALRSASAADAVTLDPVTVEGRGGSSAAAIGALMPDYAGGQVAAGGRVGLLGNAGIMDTPFSTTNFTEKLIRDQQARSVADVVINDPSVRISSQQAGIADSFYIRGFPIGDGNTGDLMFDGLFGIAPTYRMLTAYAERVEVIKGPSALLNGMAPNGSVGGAINIVPKRAADVSLARFSADYASAGQGGGHLDLGHRFGADKALGVRFNGTYSDGDTPLDRQSREAGLASLAMDYRGNSFRASLDLVEQKEDITAPFRQPMIASGVTIPSAPKASENSTQSWEYSSIEDQMVLLRLEQDIGDRLTLFAGGGRGWTRLEGVYGNPQITNSAGTISTTPAALKFAFDRVSAEAGLRSRFETGAVSHAVTLQASTYRDQFAYAFNFASAAIVSNLYNPVSVSKLGLAMPSRAARSSESELTSYAAADSLSMFDERLMVTAGVRNQQVISTNFSTSTGLETSRYDQKALTPMVGLVVKPWGNVSIYGNYIEGLTKGETAPSSASNAGAVLAPYVSKQYEAGVKLDHGGFTTTISAFQITKPSGQLTGGIYAADGEQRNRGLEFSLFGEVAPGMRLLGGAMLMDAELTRTGSASTMGNRPIGAPETQANLGVEWDTPFAEGLSLNGSLFYTGHQYADQANTQKVPDWTRLDLGARYEVAPAGRPLAVRLSLINVLGNDYWSGVASWGGLSMGPPRTVMLSASMDF